MTAYREGLPPLPDLMKGLPIDHRGYPVPWFTPKVMGEWDFQVIAPGKAAEAMRRKVCWVCGQPIWPKRLAYCIGPMCAVNRTTSEPGGHECCMRYAAQACPFLTKPRMRRPTLGKLEFYREEDGMPNAPGLALDRNPGVCLVWVTKSYRTFDAHGGQLIEIGDPVKVTAWREGREATADEIIESIRTGLPKLIELVESNAEMSELVRRLCRAWKDLKLPEQVDLRVMATEGNRDDGP